MDMMNVDGFIDGVDSLRFAPSLHSIAHSRTIHSGLPHTTVLPLPPSAHLNRIHSPVHLPRSPPANALNKCKLRPHLPGLAEAHPAITPKIVYRTDTSPDFIRHANLLIWHM